MDGTHVGAAFEQVRSKGVPQGMWRDLRVESGALCGGLQHGPGGLPRERVAPGVEEERGRTSPAQHGTRTHEIGAHGGLRLGAHGHEAFLVALTGNPQDAGRAGLRFECVVDVVDGQADDLRDAGAGAIEQLEQRPVAHVDGARGLPVRDGFDEACDLVDRESIRQMLRRGRRRDLRGDVKAQHALGDGKFVEAARDHEGSIGRGCRHGGAQPREVGLDMGAGDVAEILDPRFGEPAEIAAHIAPIVAQCIG